MKTITIKQLPAKKINTSLLLEELRVVDPKCELLEVLPVGMALQNLKRDIISTGHISVLVSDDTTYVKIQEVILAHNPAISDAERCNELARSQSDDDLERSLLRVLKRPAIQEVLKKESKL